MSTSARLRLQDLKALYQLAGECRDLGDAAEVWREHFARRIGELAGAVVVSIAEGTVGLPNFSGVVDSGWDRGGMNRSAWLRLVKATLSRSPDFSRIFTAYQAAVQRQDGVALTRTDMMSDVDWYRSEYFQYHRETGADAILYCHRTVPATKLVNMVALVRTAGERDFTHRQRALVGEAQAILTPLIGSQLAGFNEPSPTALPPQPRRVLRCLLEGDSDKQIATRLGLSRYTVNQYVKRIFEHFRVQSRPELLACWVRRGWNSRATWIDD